VFKVSPALLAAALGFGSAFGADAATARARVHDVSATATWRASALARAVTGAPGATLAAALSDGIPMRAASSVGMSTERLAQVDRVVLRGINAGGFPGASVVVGRRGYAVVKRGYGTLSWGADAAAADERTIYDLASLSKVVGTTTAIMLLFDEGKLDLDAPVRHYLPEFSGGAKDRVTVRHLLTHRSGLPAGRDLWRIAGTPTDRRRAVLATPVACAPGACFEYSDLGADVLGWVAEAVSGQRLDLLLQERVFGPLGMNDTHYRPPAHLRVRIAPTEIAPPRGYPLRGEVHDENAYALGGVAGHAGLFSTAADLSIFAQMMLNGGSYNGVRVLADSTVRLFTRRAAGTRALGWDTCNGQGGCGSIMTGNAYGHTGYTGTSIWLDPERDMFVVLLTNRVHAARAQRPAKVISDVRADLADAAELSVLDAPTGVRDMPAGFRADAAAGWNRPVRHEVREERPSRRGRGARAAKRGRDVADERPTRARAAKATRGKAAKASEARESGARSARRGGKSSAAKSTATRSAKAAKGSKSGKGRR
jgi:CubicO group peptidase (beta-lactamase class C family)